MALISTGVSSAEIKSVYSHTLKLVQNDTLPQLTISSIERPQEIQSLPLFFNLQIPLQGEFTIIS